MANQDIKHMAKELDVRLWEIASRYKGGITDGNFSRILRHELSVKDKQHIRSIIKEITRERKTS